MKVKLFCSVLLIGLSGTALAGVNEACPSPADIRHQAGVYTAPTSDAKGEWLGVVSTADPRNIKAFDSATFYSGEGKNETVGILSKCAYFSESGDRVDLRYRPGQPADIPVKLENLSAWTRGEGPFGLIKYECSSKDKGACAFVEYK